MKVQDFETVQRAASPRFRESCLECRDFETGLIFSEMHLLLIDHRPQPDTHVGICNIIVLLNEDMILALAGQFRQLSHEPEKFR